MKLDSDWLMKQWEGRSLTCDQTLAGVPRGQGVDPVWRVRDLIAAVLDGDGVASGHVGDVGHRVRPVAVVPDVRLLRFPLRVLDTATGSQRHVWVHWSPTSTS